MLFICYPRCSTCQKAKQWLETKGVAFEQRHIVDENPSYEELSKWYALSGLPIKKLFNTSVKLYKEMQLKDQLKTMSDEECLKLLATNGMLVKRPLMILENKVLVGFKVEEWEANIQ